MSNSQILEVLAAVAGGLLSVLVEIPSVKRFFDQLTDGQKRLVMGGLLIMSAAFVFGIGCAGLLDVLAPGLSVTCDAAGIGLLLRALDAALFANQSVFGLAFRGRGKKAKALPTASLN